MLGEAVGDHELHGLAIGERARRTSRAVLA